MHLTKFSFLLCLLFLGCSQDNEKLKLLFAGDLMLDRGVRIDIEKNGTDYPFEEVKKIFKTSDATIANFECTACDTSFIPSNKKFTFRTKPEWLSSLHKNGITHVSLANNHSSDYGEEGIKETANNLKQYGINYVGYSSDKNSSCSPVIIKRNTNNVAIFSASFLRQDSISFICNGNVYLLSERIKTFKESHPDYLVIICLHWGIEMRLIPTPDQVKQAHLLINAGADAIIGHHPHVVQTIELYQGRYIFYSIGNFIFDNNHSPANQGIFTSFSILNGKIEPVQIIPFNIVKSKPTSMQKEDSEKFLNEINAISPTLHLQQSGEHWEVK